MKNFLYANKWIFGWLGKNMIKSVPNEEKIRKREGKKGKGKEKWGKGYLE